MTTRLIVGITGASGIIFGIRLLKQLKILAVETHLIMTDASMKALEYESSETLTSIKELASTVYNNDNLAAPVSSGSYKTDGMIIAPCSIHSLSSIATGITDNLLTRAADVVLKERRCLVLLVRETPLHEGHLLRMLEVTRMGGIIVPPVPAFYTQPQSIDDLVNHIIGRTLDLFDLSTTGLKRWNGGKVCGI